MDSENPRLFGYLRTADDGGYRFTTIRPAHYANVREDIEQHIHFVVQADGYLEKNDRLGFADDPHWRGKQIPEWAAQLAKNDEGATVCHKDIVMMPQRD